ncbi:MAG: (Fe-S)-binding protein [Chromatiaceae bacterium]|nr:(Fe-S)-binding protein [Chromatiaceae bacterium]
MNPSTPSAPLSSSASRDAELLRLADQCVKCGLCLPHCPTYAKGRNEADSPRGRIALVQGWVSGELRLDARLAAHLDGCLLCRACERACPSKVAYGRLMDGARARQAEQGALWRRWLGWSALSLLSDRRAVAGLGGLARLSRVLIPGQRPGHWPSRWRLPRWLEPYWRLAGVFGRGAFRAARPEGAGERAIHLFVGCMEEQAQGAAVAATLAVCARLGIEARIPGQALCCGALLRHNGQPAAADRQRARCVRALGDGRTLVGFSTACVAELREAPELSATWELCDFLVAQPWPAGLAPRSLSARVLVHRPCSRRNLVGDADGVERLLGRIPGLAVEPLEDGGQCCGAAGTYVLREPSMSQRLLADLLAVIRRESPDYVVTTNAGCALQLAAGVREAGLAVAVCHPVELLARQLDVARA